MDQIAIPLGSLTVRKIRPHNVIVAEWAEWAEWKGTASVRSS